MKMRLPENNNKMKPTSKVLPHKRIESVNEICKLLLKQCADNSVHLYFDADRHVRKVKFRFPSNSGDTTDALTSVVNLCGETEMKISLLSVLSSERETSNSLSIFQHQQLSVEIHELRFTTNPGLV